MKYDAQSLDVKRAEVEFHQFAAMGEPERAIAAYLAENIRRGSILRNHRDYFGDLSPFLEIGANAGHSSYMLENEFDARGFALDISADSLRQGKILMREWGLSRAPVRIAGDALHLPFADNSLRLVMAFQMLSQFMDIEAVFLEVKRVLAPGGVFFFAEEPIRRQLSLRLYRAPYEREMKGWERQLHKAGLLGYFTKDVIGAHQEESFGIRQNHTMTLGDWHRLINKHFADERHELFVAKRGWGETSVAAVARKLDKANSDWLPARLLGGTLAAICRKAGSAEVAVPEAMTSLLRCPDCSGTLTVSGGRTLICGDCGYTSPDQEGVYNLLPTATKQALYPGLRADIVDFCQADHDDRLVSGFHGIEGSHGNRFRWIGPRAVLKLDTVDAGPHKIRIRGFASEDWLAQKSQPQIKVYVNGLQVEDWQVERSGLFVIETPVPNAPHLEVVIEAEPVMKVGDDSRQLTATISMVRLVPLR